jgi:hypothetical protein
MVDELAEDARAADAKVEFPEGAPAFRGLMQLPFRERANAARKYAQVQDLIQRHRKSLGIVGDVPLADAANLYEVLGAMDEFLAGMAVDAGAYETWPGRYRETIFIQTWNAFEAMSQTPEASSSAS